ncbi:prolyl-tRNA synthetase associated domain-containing protein [uncultured Albimonas sp.]|uniref:prolyl-tRNA synthetase associated domain-containing protein n=1 Tax=uncultured Albimonas sp. TaxID=1331701 RepID=UPI0030EC1A40|tara:strand:- start:2078 stop:2647 length:570 start_codon:yes stop_codon:yes gene_type:complete
MTALPCDALVDPFAAEAALLARLDALGIGYVRHAHPALRTVEESRALRGTLPGAHCKNLFLKDKRTGFWLAVCEEDRAIRIPDLARALGAKRFSFGAPEDMGRLLGVRPGAVTSLGLINDTGGEMRLALDAQMMAAEALNVHPLHNEATVAIATADLRRFFAATGHAPVEVDFDALEAQARAAAPAPGA